MVKKFRYPTNYELKLITNNPTNYELKRITNFFICN